MKRKFLLLTFFLTAQLLFTNCEQPLGEEDFPYEIKIVVRGVIQKDKVVENIFLGRTLPVAVPFDEDFARLKDAVGAIICDGITYPLRHIEDGLYTTDSLIARSGKTYYLLVQWQNKSVAAETKIPPIGEVVSFGQLQKTENGQTTTVIESVIAPISNEVYASTWVFLSNSGVQRDEGDEFGNVITADQKPFGSLKVQTSVIPGSVLTSDGLIGTRIYVYDNAYYDYYISQGSSQIPDAIFGQPGGNVRWNISGDGIGMFIARNDTLLILP